jgi:branched-chain amino acid aminotransferase
MSFPMLENPSGTYCYYNGRKISLLSDEGKSLAEPISDLIYYESIRVHKGIMIFFENHMLRLMTSIEMKENFELDTESLYEDAVRLIRESEPVVYEGNIRIVVTHSSRLIHLSHVFYPSIDLFQNGISTSLLSWERLDPQVKVFRGEYKAAVAASLATETSFGFPYEVLLTDQKGQITEGSRSNFFVLYKGVVYSPPEELILIGITRKYVLQAVRDAGLVYKEALFSLADLISMRAGEKGNTESIALFVTSSPFDILPVRSVEDEVFPSAYNADLAKISEIYQSIVQHYIEARSEDVSDS